jgi:ABC-type transport system involved in cytochrome c biogenesis permease component
MLEKRRKNVLLAVLAFAIVAGLLTPAIVAAPKADDSSSGKQATVFDPFAMQTVALAGDNATAPVELKLTRQTIRIPFRPGLRSAFKPAW